MTDPKRTMTAVILTLEAVVLGLTTPVLISVSDLAASSGLAMGLGLAVACLVAAGLLRVRFGYLLGCLVQVAALALGFVIGMMFLLGAVFTALFAGAVLLGRKIERERAAYGA